MELFSLCVLRACVFRLAIRSGSKSPFGGLPSWGEAKAKTQAQRTQRRTGWWPEAMGWSDFCTQWFPSI